MTNVRSWKQISKPAERLGVQSELGALVSTMAIWWGMRLASLLTHLFVSLYAYNKRGAKLQLTNLYGYGFLTCFLGVLEITYSQHAATYIHAKYVKRRSSAQGCAFWGCRTKI